jgi:DNA (cytosine-5)-methyltransferase 1
LKDPRAKTLRAYLQLVGHALPEIILLENVKGLAFDYKDEGIKLLKRGLDRINREHGVRYLPHVLHIDAADYGVAQLRERVFVVAHRDGKAFTKPSPTHGPVEKPVNGLQPYRTAWEAIGDLDIDYWPDELNVTGKWAKLLPSIPEGNNYLWHTARGGGMQLFGWRTRFWTFLLKLAKKQPSWTIQAQPGPATGPFHWRSRRLSIFELCRLQTFPDDYKILGSYREAHVQVGNAVPPVIGELLGLAIRRQFFVEDVAERPKLPSIHAGECPDPEKPQPVPVAYRSLKGKHRDHPGPGLGPGARKRATVKRAKEQPTHTRVRQPAA